MDWKQPFPTSPQCGTTGSGQTLLYSQTMTNQLAEIGGVGCNIDRSQSHDGNVGLMALYGAALAVGPTSNCPM
jgi:hypothetical protein